MTGTRDRSDADGVLVVDVVDLDLFERGGVLLVLLHASRWQSVDVKAGVGNLLGHPTVVEEHADAVGDDHGEADGVDNVCSAMERLGMLEQSPQD